VNVAVGLQTPDQDITIHPGDYIIADLNGVVVLPSDLADEAIPLMAKQVEADNKVMEALDNGMGFTEAVKRFR
jgi:regulator of RNase E activity RraA